MRIVDWFIDLWMRNCKHLDQNVAADILDGSCYKVEVKYCRRCGAVRPSYDKEWRRPRPLWFADR